MPKQGYKTINTIYQNFEVVPEDWIVQKVGDFASQITKRFDKTNSAPILSVTKYNGFVKSLEYFKKQIFSNDVSNYKMVEKGDFAYATIHLDEGSIGLLTEFEVGYISPMYTVFRVDDTVDSNFIFYLLKSEKYIQKYSTMGEGTVDRRKSITFETFSSLKIALPLKNEQQKIASILSNIDNLIDAYGKAIDSTKVLKKGLMQKLLTKGIGHKKFKKVKWFFGKEIEIPEDWEWSTFGNEGKLHSGATPRREHLEYYNGKIPWVSSGELDRNIIMDTYEHISPLALRNTSLKLYPEGTFLFAITGLEAKGTRGRCAILGVKATINQSCMALYDSNSVLPQFVFFYFLNFGEKIIFSLAQGTKQQSLNLEISKSIKIPVPSLKEQQKIVNILSPVDLKINELKSKKSHLEILKKGLMQKLLTGQIRVKV